MGRPAKSQSPAKASPLSRELRSLLGIKGVRRSTTIEKKEVNLPHKVTKSETTKKVIKATRGRKKKKVELVVTRQTLRPREKMKFIWRTGKDSDDEFDLEDSAYMNERKPRKKVKREYSERTSSKKDWIMENFDDIYEEESTVKKSHIEEALDKIPKNKKQLQKLKEKVEERLEHYKEMFITEQVELSKKTSKVPETSIPICGDVRTFDFQKLAEAQKKFGGRLFDVIMIDPPWQLSTSQPSRGVAIAYESLADEVIQRLPISKLQDNGFIFLWTINAKYALAAKLIEHWGYKLVDEVTWIKKTINGKIAKGHGFYLQHAKESCLVGVKGKVTSNMKKNIGSDVIFSQRRGQSQKPEEIYTLIEKLVPNGFYLELFGRRNNIRSRWVTLGNEL